MKSFIRERNIEFLTHFTRCTNLENIFKFGLLPRQRLDHNGIESIYNDDIRYDGYLNASCLSISFPNYKMFYQLRCENPGVNWAVIGIHPHVLYNKTCLFCKENAASGVVLNTPISDKKGLTGLKKMFEDYPHPRTRISMGIGSHLTTNPQAEVLVFDDITIDDIFGVAFCDHYTANKYKSAIPKGVNVVVNETLFYGRCDYEYWRN